MTSRVGRAGLRCERQTSEGEAGNDETSSQRGIVMSTKRRGRSTSRQENSDAAASEAEDTPPVLEVESSRVSDEMAKGPPSSGISISNLSRRSTEPMSAAQPTSDHIHGDATPGTMLESRSTLIQPPALNLSVIPQPPVPVTTPLHPPLPLPLRPLPQPTSTATASAPSTPSTPTPLALHAASALLRPASISRARPSARQVSLPGSRFGRGTAEAGPSSAGTVTRTMIPDLESNVTVPKSAGDGQVSVKDSTIEKRNTVPSHGINQGSKYMVDTGQQQASDEDGDSPDKSLAGQEVNDEPGVDEDVDNADWAADVSSDSDDSGDTERRLMIEDHCVSEERGSVKRDAVDQAVPVSEAVSDDSESELVIDDGTIDDGDQDIPKSGQPDKQNDEVRPRERRKSKPPRPSKFGLTSIDGSEEMSGEYPKMTPRQTKTRTAGFKKPSCQKPRDPETKNVGIRNAPKVASVQDVCSQEGGKKRIRKAPDGNAGEKHKRKRHLAESDNEDECDIPPTCDVEDQDNTIPKEGDIIPEPTIHPSSSASCHATHKPVARFVPPPPRKKQPVGAGSRLLAKLRRANSIPAAAPSPPSSRLGTFQRDSSSRLDSSARVGSSVREGDSSRPDRSQPVPARVMSSEAKGGPPAGDLQALGDWTTRPRECRSRRDEEDDGGLVDVYIPGPVPLAGARLKRMPPVHPFWSASTRPETVRAERVVEEKKATSLKEKADYSHELSRAPSVKGVSSGSCSTNSAKSAVKSEERIMEQKKTTPKAGVGTDTYTSREPPATPQLPRLLEAVEDYRTPAKRPRLAHQPSVVGAARQATTATTSQQRKTPRPTPASEEQPPQLPSFYQLLKPPPSPTHPSPSAMKKEMTTPPSLVSMAATPLPRKEMVASSRTSKPSTPQLFNKPGHRLTESELAELISRLLESQPETADWNQLLNQLAARSVTDESIVSHLCHRVAVTPPPPPDHYDPEPTGEVLRACACAAHLERRGRPRLRWLLRLACRQQLLHRRPELPPPCRLQLLRLHTAVCRLMGAAGQSRAMLLDMAVLRPQELCPALMSLLNTWSKVFRRRKGVDLCPMEKVLLHHVLSTPPASSSDTLNTLQAKLKHNYGLKEAPRENAESHAAELVTQMAGGLPAEGEASHLSALLLLSALHGPEWTSRHPLERGVVPVLAYRRSEGAAAAAVTLTGQLASLYRSPTDRQLEEAVVILEGLVWRPRTAGSTVTHAAKSAIRLLLRRHLPAESENRLRRCLKALSQPVDSAVISGANGEADECSSISAQEEEVEVQGVSRWFGTTGEFF